MNVEKGQETLNQVESKISLLYPKADLVRTPMSLKLEPINKSTASLELIIETGDFFTVVVNGHSLELTLSPHRCVEVFEAVLNGSCRQTFLKKGEKTIKVSTEIELHDETIRYERFELAVVLGKTQSETVQFEPFWPS